MSSAAPRSRPATRSTTTTPTTKRSPRSPQHPLAVVRPATAAEVARVVELAAEAGVPLTARGSGTGLSGACIPVDGGIVVSFERMNEILEIDLDNHVAVVQPGVTLEQLDQATRPHGLVYPVFPGESSASLGGNVATNAGGMRAVKYGVTRHQVLGLEAVLGTGEVIRTGGKFVKATTGYDLTQLIVGSEGTLALVTEATLRLYPRPAHAATVLAPFATLDDVTAAVPKIVASGIGPLLVEYIDFITMDAIARPRRRARRRPGDQGAGARVSRGRARGPPRRPPRREHRRARDAARRPRRARRLRAPVGRGRQVDRSA